MPRYNRPSSRFLLIAFLLLTGISNSQAPKISKDRTETLLFNGRFLILESGSANGKRDMARIKDARSGSETILSNQPPDVRIGHTATALPDGKILIFGGFSLDGHVHDEAEVFDPETQTFQSLSINLTPRAFHTATVLIDGKVLFVGGVSNNGELLGNAEIWDSHTKLVQAVPSGLLTPRSGHRAKLLTEGNILIWGGRDQNENVLVNEEEYNPELQQFVSGRTPVNHVQNSPQIVVSLPADGSNEVKIDVFISLQFSDPLLFESVNPNSLQLSSIYGSESVKAIPADEGTLLFVKPEKPLLAGVTYKLSITGLKAKGGYQIQDATITFSTQGEKDEMPDNDDEEWVPKSGDFSDGWRTGRPPSPWQSMAPLQAPTGVTALAGQLLKLNGKPLANVTLQVDQKVARSDENGQFLLYPLEPGRHELIVDGRTANKPGRKYGIFEIGVELVDGKTNALSYTIWMPRIDTVHSVKIPSATIEEVIITTPRIPGLKINIPPNTVIRDHEGSLVTEISITPIPLDRPPFPFPENVSFPLYFTVQPGGSYIHGQGVRITYPNITWDAPGTRFDFWHYEPEDTGWYVYGMGSVTPDQKQVQPDPGVFIYEFTGSSMAQPPAPPVESPAPGGCSMGSDPEDGDPVDCSTGIFLDRNTDMVLPDVQSIALVRTYRTRDSTSRSFGIGASHSYDLRVWLQNDEVFVILPDGAKIRYSRITSGTGYDTSQIFEHTYTPTFFFKSQIQKIGTEWKLTFKDGSIYTFDAIFYYYYLKSIQDRNGNGLTINRDGGFITSIVPPNGRILTFTYNWSKKRIEKIQDNIGSAVNYVYDAGGRLWKVTDPMGRITEYTYDSSGNMLTIKKPNGLLYVTNQYDANGRVIQQTRTDGTTFQFTYTLDGNGKVIQTNITNPRGFVRKLTFNSNGYILTDTRALGTSIQQAVSYERQPGTNLVLSSTDQLGRRVVYTYDSISNLTNVTLLAGTSQAVTVSISYEPVFNRIASMTDPLNHTVTATRDSKGNPISLQDPLGNITQLSFNQAGQPTSMIDPLGNIAQFTYEFGDLIAGTDPLGNSTKQFINIAGRLISSTNPLGQTIRYEYDLLNRVTRAIDPLQGSTTFAYDLNDNLLSVTDARGNGTNYAYNNMDRVISRTDPLSRTESYQYDPGGNVIRTTDRKGQITNYTYDALDRLTQIVYSDGSTTSYTYDALNRLTQVIDSIGGAITMSYDSFDRLISETTAQGSISYAHDAVGRRTSMTVNGQASVNYVYDAANRVTQISQGTSNAAFAYDPAGRRTSVSFSNGIVVQYSYNAVSQLIEIKYMRGTTVLGNLTYQYDLAGRRTKTAGSFARSSLPNPITSATYDSSNQQLTFGSQSLNYDANGNLNSDGVNTFSWNVRDQLVSVNGPGVSSNFQYDSFGRRKTKTVNGTSTSYLYDGLNPVQELSGSTPTANLLTGSGIDEYLMRTDSSGPRFFLRDSLGSTIGLADSTGSLVTSYTYEAFGKTITVGAASTNSFQFTGRENDGTGLFHYRARYYHPTLQRFISEDPIGFAGGDLNLYAYVMNDPMNSIDPTGMEMINYYNDEPVCDGEPIEVGQPGTAESFIPVWGSGRAALDDFQNGNHGWAAFNTGLMISDMCLVRSIAGGILKGGWKFGSHEWGRTAQWYKKSRGIAGSNPAHHWFIEQKSTVGKLVPKCIKNQPFNLMPTGNRVFHDSIHGRGKMPFNQLERTWYGTPEWYKSALASSNGHSILRLGNTCDCD